LAPLVVLLLTIGVGVVVSALPGQEKAPPRAAVFALLRVAKEQPQVLGSSQVPADRRDDFESFRQMQAALVKSRMVVGGALRNPDVAKLAVVREQGDPVGWLTNGLQVDFQLAPEIMRVGLEGGKSEELATLVDAVVNTYLAEIIAKESRGKDDRLEQLRQLAARYEEKLKEKQQQLRAATEVTGANFPSALRRELLVQDLLDCKRELRRVRLARAAVGAQAGKGKDGGLDDNALAAQERILRDEEKELLAQANQMDRTDGQLSQLRTEVEQVENVARRVMAQVEALTVEIQAPPRVTLLEQAVIRKAK
jgi:hypothetical protein